MLFFPPLYRKAMRTCVWVFCVHVFCVERGREEKKIRENKGVWGGTKFKSYSLSGRETRISISPAVKRIASRNSW